MPVPILTRACAMAALVWVVGTTNDKDYLRYDLGVRRWWPVTATVKYAGERRDKFLANRDQNLGRGVGE